MASCIWTTRVIWQGLSHKEPNLYPILYTLEEKGDEIISKAISIVLEMDIE